MEGWGSQGDGGVGEPGRWRGGGAREMEGWGSNSGFWVLGFGFWILDFGFWPAPCSRPHSHPQILTNAVAFPKDFAMLENVNLSTLV